LINQSQPRRIAVVLIDGFALMSLAAVSEPLRAANLLAGKVIYRLDLFHAATSDSPARPSASAIIVKTQPIAAAPDGYDLAFVVAGGDPVGFHHAETSRWLRRQARRSHILGGVSGGPAILANAGVMDNRRMTVHWEHAAALAERHPGLMLERGLYVMDRDRLTCAGGIAPLDMMHAPDRRASWWRLRPAGQRLVHAHRHPPGWRTPTRRSGRALRDDAVRRLVGLGGDGQPHR